MNPETTRIVREASEMRLSHVNNANALAALKGDPLPNVLAIDKAMVRYDENIAGSQEHFTAHRDVLIENAIADATSRGISINYPPYTS